MKPNFSITILKMLHFRLLFFRKKCRWRVVVEVPNSMTFSSITFFVLQSAWQHLMNS